MNDKNVKRLSKNPIVELQISMPYRISHFIKRKVSPPQHEGFAHAKQGLYHWVIPLVPFQDFLEIVFCSFSHIWTTFYLSSLFLPLLFLFYTPVWSLLIHPPTVPSPTPPLPCLQEDVLPTPSRTAPSLGLQVSRGLGASSLTEAWPGSPLLYMY